MTQNEKKIAVIVDYSFLKSNLTNEAYKAFLDRLAALQSHCGEESVEFLLGSLDENDLKVEEWTMLFGLVVAGRYLDTESSKFWENKKLLLSKSSFIEFIKSHVSLISKLIEDSKYIILIPITHESIITIVDHTYWYPHQTGIQRVVRKLLTEWRSNKLPIILIKFRSNSLIPEVFSKEQEESFFSTKKTLMTKTKKQSSDLFKRLQKKHNQSFLLEFLRLPYVLITYFLNSFAKKSSFAKKTVKFLDSFKEAFVLFYSKKKVLPVFVQNEQISLPIFWRRRVFLPELVTFTAAIDYWLNIQRNSRIEWGMIGYDLIPIIYPEYCGVESSKFVDYMRLLRRANKVTCISNQVAKQFQDFVNTLETTINKPRVNAHPLAVSFNESQNTSVESSPPSDILRILCVGTLEPRKNQILLLNAAKILKRRDVEIEIVFVGHLGWNYEGIYEEITNAKNQGLKVEFLVGVSDHELLIEYQKASICCALSIAEGFGLPIIESLYYQKPCIITPLGCFKEISDQYGGCIFTEFDDPKFLADQILKFILNPSLLLDLKKTIKLDQIKNWNNYSNEIYNFLIES